MADRSGPRWVHLLPVYALVVLACAQRVPITGGEKDVLPPQLIKSEPDTFSTHFSTNKIKLEFNEFVQLNRVQNNLLITPVMKEEPVVVANGKRVLIKNINDSLWPNSTYVIEFNEAIRDITENNAAKGFRYVFSTGDYVDSLNLSGELKDAYTLEPVEDAFVFLYENKYDSVPYKEIPRYIGRSDKSGVFTMKNLKRGFYKAFICTDENRSYKYDRASERVDFLDSSVRISPETDSRIEAYLFREEESLQFLKGFGSLNAFSFYLVFNRRIDTLEIDTTAFHGKVISGFKREYGENRDSVVFWMPDTSYGIDTARFIAKVDTLPGDTVSIAIPRGGKPEKVSWRTNMAKGKLDLGKNLVLDFDLPLIDIRKEGITLFRDSDQVDFDLERNSLRKRIEIIAKWVAESKYRLVIDTAAIFNIEGSAIDSTVLAFETYKSTYYGTLSLKLSTSEERSGLLIIMDANNKPIDRIYLDHTNNYYFEYMHPGTYKLKYIADENENRRWDSGNYLKGRHAERVFIYQGTITIRSNWDQSIEWKFN